ncbi:MAG: 3-oxoacid CoA-transferase [Chloroflexi bacterium]|nr:3-oxoacid CoA-transferase [Chloroflexota bacterium]MBU1746616.1 3-oxoacid CoA-transferase [Chloroflexota bacterium]
MAENHGRYNLTELLACVAAGLLQDGKSAFVGTGLPLVAGMLAQRTHAPRMLIIFEAGGIGPRVPELPISVGDSRTFYQAVAASSMHDVMSACQNGYVDYCFLGGAAVDPYGNLNTTVIGDWANPKVRLPGSGGANDLGSFSWQTIILLRGQSPRTFVEKLDFVTTPGYLTGPGAREAAGLPADTGPYRVITQLGVFGFHEETKRMELLAVHPGVTIEEARGASGFEIGVHEPVGVTAEPTDEQLRVLREVDPRGRVIGK